MLKYLQRYFTVGLRARITIGASTIDLDTGHPSSMPLPRPPKPPVRARLLFIGYALRLLAPRLLSLVGLTVGGGLVMQGRLAVHGKKVDFPSAAYEVYTQLFFEHVSPLPKDWVLRILYFAVPLCGALILAEGLFKLGASLLDFQNHRERWMGIMAKTLQDHIIVVGLGHVGYRVLRELLERGRPVVAVEADKTSPYVEEARKMGVPVIISDARRESLWGELNVAGASCVVACTDNDLANLEAALDCRSINPEIRLVMRMFDQTMAAKIGNAFALDRTYSTSALAAPLFAAAALDNRVHGAYRLGETLMMTLELELPESSVLENQTIHAVEEQLEAPIVGTRRRNRPASHRFSRSETLKPKDAIIAHVPAAETEALTRRWDTLNRPASDA